MDQFVHPHPAHHLILPIPQHTREGRIDVADHAVLKDVDTGQIGLGECLVAGLKGASLLQGTALEVVVLPEERAHSDEAEEHDRSSREPVNREKGVVRAHQPAGQPALSGSQGKEAIFQPAPEGRQERRAEAQEKPGQNGKDQEINAPVAHQASPGQGDGGDGVADPDQAPGPQREGKAAQETQQEDGPVEDGVGKDGRPLAGVQEGLSQEQRDSRGSGPAHRYQEHAHHAPAPDVNGKVRIAHADSRSFRWHSSYTRPVHQEGGPEGREGVNPRGYCTRNCSVRKLLSPEHTRALANRTAFTESPAKTHRRGWRERRGFQ